MKMYVVKKLILFLLLVLFSCVTYAQVRVNGYYKKNGTYVQPHYRSSPNNTKMDNWSTKGNINPYTGKEGTKNVDFVPVTFTEKQDTITNVVPDKYIPDGNNVKKLIVSDSSGISVIQKSGITDSVVISYFMKDYTGSKEVLSVSNKSSATIHSFVIRIIYKDLQGNSLDYKDLSLSGIIPPQLAKRFEIESFAHDFVYKDSDSSVTKRFTIVYQVLQVEIKK